METQRYPYTIRFDEKAEDERLEFWRSHGMETEGGVVVNFTIIGEKGCAYPPFLAVNSQHTMFLKQENGVWKIIFHYYSGASRFRNKTLEVPGEDEMLARLKDEFKTVSETDSERALIPAGTVAYAGTQAAEYAMKYAETANPIFYNAGDWQGKLRKFYFSMHLGGVWRQRGGGRFRTQIYDLPVVRWNGRRLSGMGKRRIFLELYSEFSTIRAGGHTWYSGGEYFTAKTRRHYSDPASRRGRSVQPQFIARQPFHPDAGTKFPR